MRRNPFKSEAQSLVPFKSREEALGYLAGMIDGEGTVSTNHRHRAVRISNTDMALLAACGEALTLLGIEWRIYPRKSSSRPEHWAQAYDLTIFGRENFLKLVEVPLRSKKADLIQNLLSWYSQLRRSERPLEKIRELYEQGSSLADIERILGIPSPTLHLWMVEAGIPRRSHKEAGTLVWQPGGNRRAV
jgi:hypothetical protein